MSAVGSVASDPSASAEAGLLERASFTAALAEHLAAVSAGGGRLVLVSGEAGIGKSALVRRFCDSRRAHVRVLWGACDALQTPRPLSPLIDIAALSGGTLLASVRAVEKPHAVFVALVEALRETRPTIAVVEDVHWADEATLDVVRLLARRAESLGALVLVTYREDELDATHPLRLAVGELGTAPGVAHLRIPPLSRDAVAELAEPHGVDPDELHLRTAGNPFFVTEVLAGGDAAVPPTVRDAVLARVSRLGTGAQRVLEAVAIVPPHAELWLLDALVPDKLVHLDACLAAGMLRSEGRIVSFRHELARLAVEQSIGPHRRLVLHRRALEALRHPPEGEPDAAQLAHHADAAGDASAVLEFATLAGARAALGGAHREAAAQYGRAVRYAGSLPRAELAALLELRAQECYLTDQMDDAVSAQERALGCYREVGDPSGEGMALVSLSQMIWCPGRVDESERAARDAIDALADLEFGREMADAWVNLAGLVVWTDPGGAVDLAARARELADRVGAPDISIGAGLAIDAMQYSTGLLEGRARIEETLDRAAVAGLDVWVAHAYMCLVDGSLQGRSYALLDTYMEAGLAYCGERDFELYERYLHAFRARSELDRGRWAAAIEAAMLVMHDRGPSILPLLWVHMVVGLVRARRGDPRPMELLDLAHELAQQQGQIYAVGLTTAALAEAAWLEGRHEDVVRLTDAVLARALELPAWRITGELARWRWRAGLREEISGVAAPDAATLAGDWERAARLWGELGCPYEAALALGDADDDGALKRGLGELQRLGARPAAAILTQRLRERGARGVPRGPNASSRQNPASLTARELEVLALLADGLRNAEIASRLVVSPRTVDHQVSAVLRKLGARTRGEAVAIAARDDLTKVVQ